MQLIQSQRRRFVQSKNETPKTVAPREIKVTYNKYPSLENCGIGGS